MSIDYNLLEPAFSIGYDLLPATLHSHTATNLLLAIGWQESRFEHRTQIGGPAKGFWQFERMGGVKGVLEHRLSKTLIRDVLLDLQYPANMDAASCHAAIEHNDVLAFCFARLLLYVSPIQIPALDDSSHGWGMYVACWRPGKPHPDTWPRAWAWAAQATDF